MQSPILDIIYAMNNKISEKDIDSDNCISCTLNMHLKTYMGSECDTSEMTKSDELNKISLTSDFVKPFF